MGSEVSLSVHPPAALPACLPRVQHTFTTVEAAASRFASDSELNQLARGERAAPSAVLRTLRDAAEAIAELTGGLVTPFERRALESAGYDAPFAEIRAGQAGRHFAPFSEWGRLDFGGSGKGWTVDRALADIAGFCDGALLDAGGDIGVVGAPPPGRAWQVTIAARADGTPVALRGGGIATSSTRGRRWRGPLGPAHHIIDPRTGRPAQSGLVEASVWARDTLSAEVAAKALVIGGRGVEAQVREWFPEAVLFTLLADGSEQTDAAFRSEVLACAS